MGYNMIEEFDLPYIVHLISVLEEGLKSDWPTIEDLRKSKDEDIIRYCEKKDYLLSSISEFCECMEGNFPIHVLYETEDEYQNLIRETTSSSLSNCEKFAFFLYHRIQEHLEPFIGSLSIYVMPVFELVFPDRKVEDIDIPSHHRNYEEVTDFLGAWFYDKRCQRHFLKGLKNVNRFYLDYRKTNAAFDQDIRAYQETVRKRNIETLSRQIKPEEVVNLVSQLLTDNPSAAAKDKKTQPKRPESPAAGEPKRTDLSDKNTLRKGSVWEICYRGKRVHLDGALEGLPLLAYLLTHPDEKPISALNLERAVNPAPRGEKFSRVAEAIYDPENMSGSLRVSRTGQNIDARSLAKAEEEELNQLLEKVEGDFDKARNEADKDRIESDIKHIENEIGRRKNHQGKKRPAAGDPFEKARQRVRRKIKTVQKKLEGKEGHKELSDHLKRYLKTGIYCTYTPETNPDWHIL